MNELIDARRRRVRMLLRPVRESAVVRTIALPRGRYAVGSDPASGVCLPVPGVEPRHCELLVGKDAISIRARSRFTWINDGAIRESVLRPGDRLSIGPLEFEVQSPGRRKSSLANVAPLFEQAHAQKALKGALDRAERAISQHERQQLGMVLHADPLRIDAEELEREQASLRTSKRSVERRARMLEELRSDLLLQLGELLERETLTAARERKLVEDSGRLEGHRRSLQDQTHSLDQERLELAEQRRQSEGEWSEIRAARVEIGAARDTLERERTRVAADLSELQSQHAALERRAAELSAQEAELLERSRELDRHTMQHADHSSRLAEQEAELQRRERECAAEWERAATELANGKTQLERDRTEIEAGWWELRSARQVAQTERDRLSVLKAELDATNTSLDERNQLVSQFRAELDERSTAIDLQAAELQDRAQRLQERETSLQQQEAELDRRREQLESDLDERTRTHQASVQHDLERLEQQRAELDRLQTELADQQGRLTDEQSQMQRSMADAALRLQDIEDRTARLKEAEQAVARREAELEGRRHELQQQDSELTLRVEQVTHRESELTAALERLELERRRFAELEESANDLACERNLLNAEAERISQTQSELERKAQQIAEQSLELTRRQEELAAHENRSQELRRQLETELAEKNADFTAQKADLEREWAALSEQRTSLAESAEAIESRALELSRRESELTAAESALRYSRLEQGALEDQFVELGRQRAAFLQSSELLERERNRDLERREELERTSAELNERMQALAASEAQLAESRSLLEREKTQYDAELSQKRQALEAAADELQARQHALDSESTRINRLSEELACRQAELSRSEESLADRVRLHHQLEQEAAQRARQQEAAHLAATDELAANWQTCQLEVLAQAQKLAQLAAREDRLQQQTRDFAEARQRADEETAAVLRELATEREQLASERSRLEQLQQQIQVETQQLSDQRIRLEHREHELRASASQLADAHQLQESLDAESARLQQLQSEIQVEREQLAAARNDHHSEVERLRESANSLADREAAVAALEERWADYQRLRAEHDVAAEELRTQQAQIRSEKEQLEAAELEFNRRQQDLAGRFDDLEQRHSDLSRQAEALTARETQVSDQVQELVRREEELCDRLRQLEQQALQSAELQQTLITAEAERDATLSLAAEFRSQIEELERTQAELTRALNDQRAKADALGIPTSLQPISDQDVCQSAEAAGWESHRRQLQEELDFLREKSLRDQEEFARAREAWEAEQDLLVRDRMALEAEWHRLEAKVNQLYSQASIPASTEPKPEAWADPSFPEPQHFNTLESQDFAATNALATGLFERDGHDFQPTLDGEIDNPTLDQQQGGAQDNDVLRIRAQLAEMFGMQQERPAEQAWDSPVHADTGSPAMDAGELSTFGHDPQVRDIEFHDVGTDEFNASASEQFSQPGSFDQPLQTMDDFDSGTASPSSDSPTDEDGSHEEIMSAYLDRILGRKRQEREAPLEVVEETAPPVEQPPAAAPEDSAPRLARRLNDEEKEALRANMDSFRELANMQARVAVAKHKSNELKSGLQLTSVFAALVAVVGIVLLTAEFWSNKSYRTSGLVALLTAAGIGITMLFNSFKLKQLQALQRTSAGDLDNADDAPPTDPAADSRN